MAARIPGAADKSPDELAAAGVELLMAGIRETLERYRVSFDHWFLERSLYEGAPSAWDEARAKLLADGLAYESEGALWLRTTTLAGDEKDRPLVKSSGEPTYLAADVAYHWDKLHRGFDTLVNVLGSDHHGYVVRLKAIIAAEGADPDRLVVPLLQFVHVVEGGERASMSKRRGDFVTLAELIDEIGVDATRFFMLSRSADSTVDLDLTLAKEQSRENPVYYVQYAHARMSKILRDAGEERVAEALAAAARRPRARARRARAGQEAARLPGDGRRGRRPLRAAPASPSTRSSSRRPSPPTTATARSSRSSDEALKSFRLATTVATRRVVARSLGLLGVSAPETM